MIDQRVLIEQILWVVEGIVEQSTTERVFYGYEDDGKLTEKGEVAAELIGILLRMERIRANGDYSSGSDGEGHEVS
jgi:broad specificity phosphatase PhoE